MVSTSADLSGAVVAMGTAGSIRAGRNGHHGFADSSQWVPGDEVPPAPDAADEAKGRASEADERDPQRHEGGERVLIWVVPSHSGCMCENVQRL